MVPAADMAALRVCSQRIDIPSEQVPDPLGPVGSDRAPGDLVEGVQQRRRQRRDERKNVGFLATPIGIWPTSFTTVEAR